MQVLYLNSEGVEEHDQSMLAGLLDRSDGFVWVDIAEWDARSEEIVTETFGLHPIAVEACRQRNHVPTIHGYRDHVFVILHSPEGGGQGHVHLLELDLVIGARFLVTVHGPINPVVPLERALTQTQAVLARIRAGRFMPNSPAELSYAVVSAMARQQRQLIGDVAERIPDLEGRVMRGSLRNPEDLLDEMFLLRQELITVRTMAAQTHDIYARMGSLARGVLPADLPFAKDLAEQFDRVRSIADGESQFLFGVIDLYQTRVTTKMTLAMERLAVIAAVTLPVTAIASVYGMNVIVNTSTHWVQLVIVVAVMLLISGLLLRWARNQGWW